MNKIDFWSEWEAPYRLAFKVLSVFILLLIATALVLELGDVSYFYSWEVTGYLQEVLLPVHSNHSSFIESTVNVEVPLLFQKALGSYELLSPWVVYLFMAVLYIAMMGGLTVVTFLNRFWYIVCVGLFILLLAGSGVGRLGILGLYDEMAIGVAAILFVPLSYYFNTINEGVSILHRFLAFLGALTLMMLLIFFLSEQSAPLLHFAYYSYWPALIISIVFILVIGHEIVYAILILTTQDAKEGVSGNTKHFVVLSLIYLVNVAMVYMKNTNYIDWDFYYINAFLLVSVSTVLGVWGLKGRQMLYEKALPFYPYAVLLYFSLAAVCFSSLVFFTLSANDPTLEVLEDAIIFGHLGFGSMFFIYIIVNFISLMLKNLPIYKVAFKEDNFPYATSRLAGLIVVAAFFFASNYASLNQSISGYFNGLGDLNLRLGNQEAATTFFRRGSTYGNILNHSNDNHRSNYMLGALETDPEKVIPKMKSATQKHPSEFAYASLGAAYESDNRFFEAVFIYQEGLKEFPESWALRNNLGLLYNRTSVTDSAIFHLKNSNGNSWQTSIINSNILAVSTMRNFPLDESLNQEEINQSNRLGLKSNWLAYQSISNNPMEVDQVLTQASLALNLFTYSYLNNLGVVCALNGNGSFLSLIDGYIEEPRNADYRLKLLFVKGLNLYKQGFVSASYELMNALKEEDDKNESKINALLGKWSMELGSPLLASKYFELSRESGYPWVTTDLSQTYALLGEASLSQFILTKEIKSIDSTQHEILEQMTVLEEAIVSGEVNWPSTYNFDSELQNLEKLKSLASGENRETIAVDFEIFGMKNPFFEQGVLESADYFSAVKKDKDTAYNILLNAITINEYSVPLIKAYIAQCFNMGLTNYAEGTILRLYDILDLESYQLYELEFEKKKEHAADNLEDWGEEVD